METYNIDWTKPNSITLLKQFLNFKEAHVTVKFTKSDGSERIMKCTTSMELIPVDKFPKSYTNPDTEEKPKEEKVETAQRVFDLEANEWRSFKFDSIISVTITL